MTPEKVGSQSAFRGLLVQHQAQERVPRQDLEEALQASHPPEFIVHVN